ncbi:hypothetical protein DPMN_117493 [Dreissena polymorpha]|uniref:Uncharacterized protein n=1 Tax=Dreissena polymorpha TaxID=45954 RepID=A0A9D4QUY7_DREPO|nr:hypothetical protein DPMN_117493 [Dreissena polymorpha]
MSEPVPVSNEELMTQRYRPDAGHTLYMDHWVHVHLLGHLNGTEQVRLSPLNCLMKT